MGAVGSGASARAICDGSKRNPRPPFVPLDLLLPPPDDRFLASPEPPPAVSAPSTPLASGANLGGTPSGHRVVCRHRYIQSLLPSAYMISCSPLSALNPVTSAA